MKKMKKVYGGALWLILVFASCLNANATEAGTATIELIAKKGEKKFVINRNAKLVIVSKEKKKIKVKHWEILNDSQILGRGDTISVRTIFSIEASNKRKPIRTFGGVSMIVVGAAALPFVLHFAGQGVASGEFNPITFVWALTPILSIYLGTEVLNGVKYETVEGWELKIENW